MTRYDPFAFGQVNLSDEQPAALPPSPDDLLFADGVACPRNAPPADSSWGLLDADVDSLLPTAKATVAPGLDFGAEVLGETVPMPAAPVRPRPSTAPRPAAPAAAASAKVGPRSVETPRHEVGVRPLPTPAVTAPVPAAPAAEAPAKPPTYVARKPSSVGRVGRQGLTATVVPTLVFVGGGVTAAWLFETEQNTMMAAIAFALTLVATGFTRLLLRG
jgi:hypothetical protein